MATAIIAILLALIVGAVIWKMISDKRSGKSSCSGGGDCARCHGACHSPR